MKRDLNPAWFQIVCGIISIPWFVHLVLLAAVAIAAFLIGRWSHMTRLLAILSLSCALGACCAYQDDAGAKAAELTLQYGDHENARDIEADQ